MLLAQQLAGHGGQDGPSPEAQHPRVLRHRCCDSGPLELAERLFAVVEEKLRDALAGTCLDVGVGVTERHLPALRQQPADGGLASTGGPDQDGPGPGHRIVRVDR